MIDYSLFVARNIKFGSHIANPKSKQATPAHLAPIKQILHHAEWGGGKAESASPVKPRMEVADNLIELLLSNQKNKLPQSFNNHKKTIQDRLKVYLYKMLECFLNEHCDSGDRSSHKKDNPRKGIERAKAFHIRADKNL